MQNRGLGDILRKYVERLFDHDRIEKGKKLLDRVTSIHKEEDRLMAQVIDHDTSRVTIPTIKLPRHSAGFFEHRYREELKKPSDERMFFHLGDGSKVDHLFNSYAGNIYGKAKCNCPDDVSMCRHIAAVLFMIIKNLDENDETLYALMRGYETQQYSNRINDTAKEIPEHDNYLDYFNNLSIVDFNEVTNVSSENVTQPTEVDWETIDLDKIPDYRDAIEKVIVDITFKENVSTVLYIVTMYRTPYYREKDERIKNLAIDFNNRDCIYYPEQNLFSFKHQESGREVKMSVEHVIRYLDSLSKERVIEMDNSLIQSLWIAKNLAIACVERKSFQAGLYRHASETHKIILKPHMEFLKSDEAKIFSRSIDMNLFKIGYNNVDYDISHDSSLEYLCSIFMTNELERAIKAFKFNDFLQYSSGIDGQLSKSLWLDSQTNLINYASFVNCLYKPSYDWDIQLDVESYDKDVVFQISFFYNEEKYSFDELKDSLDVDKERKRFFDFSMQVLRDCGFVLEGDRATLFLSRLKNIAEIRDYLKFYGITINAPDTLFNPDKLEFNVEWDVDDDYDYLMDSEVSISLLDNRLNFISEENLRSFSDSGEGVYELNNEFYYIDESVLQVINEYLNSPRVISGNKMLRSVLMEEHQGQKIHFGEHLVSMRNKLFEIPELEIPEEFVDVLRPYQEDGLKWLWKNTQLGLGSLLADDMGLGKTIQLLALISAMYKRDENLKALIVVPTAVISNWMSEAEVFVPHITFHAHYGSDREIVDIQDHNIIITSYGMIRSDYEQLKETPWDLIALDEAQKIKNPSTKISKVIKQIPSRVKVALTGTPVENRLLEYWNILDYLNRGMLGGKTWFKKNIAAPIEKHGDKNKLQKFVKMTSPFILRRLKTDKDIISDLPDKIVSNEICDLSPKQKTMYHTYVKQMLKVIESNIGIKRKGLILKMMTDLKKICNHPAHFNPEQKLLIKQSGKLNYLMNLLEIIRENDEKVLVFSQYVQMGLLLKDFMYKEFGMKVGFYHGSLNRGQRDKVLTEFKESNGFDVLIISLKAGGTGLNLTEASHVIHYDLWWNPAVEDQATDRAFRIGQDKNVYVQRLISKGTFEEKINKMLQSKRGLADSVLNVESNWIGEMSNEELSELFALEENLTKKEGVEA